MLLTVDLFPHASAGPSKDDAAVFNAISKVNKEAVAQYPAVQGWSQTMWLFKPEVRATW
jgi:hypothetical protein